MMAILTNHWFERITGFPEAGYTETQERLRVEDGFLISETSGVKHAVGDLEFPSLDDLRRNAENVRVPGDLSLEIVEGDVRAMHADALNSGAVFQVASQFNLLEMVGPNVTPEAGVTRYAYDNTQGPACAIAAGAGTIWRNYLVPIKNQLGQTAERQLDGLEELGDLLARDMGLEPGSLWKMRNGYALPEHTMLARMEEHLESLSETERDRLRGLLRVGVHRHVGVTEDGAPPDMRVTQVYCSALPVAYSGILKREWTRLASLVLEAAYEATFLAAVINASQGFSNRLLLTRLGGGAFGNDEAWISAAILRALHITAHQGLDVVMVSHGSPSSAVRAVEADWREAQDIP